MGTEKRSPSRKVRVYPKLRRLLGSPPRARNKKQLFEQQQQQQQQQQQLQQLWLNVDFVCSMLFFPAQS